MRVVVGVLAALLAMIGAARSADVADFFRGKTVNVVVGYGPGGGYDLYARLLARYLGAHIPGNPSVVVQNMPGAAGMRAANYLFQSAPRDGTMIGTFDMNIPLVGFVGGNPAIQYDARKFNWLGSLSNAEDDAYVLWSRKDAAVQSGAEFAKPGAPPFTLGVIGPGATDYDLGVLLRDVFGLPFRIVSGYPNSAAVGVAIDNSEIDGEFVSYVSSKIVHPTWGSPSGPMRVLLQFARTTRHPDLPDAPLVVELARNDLERQLIETAEAPYKLSRPYVAPPGLPADRADALRAAFRAAATDPALVREGAGMTLDISPVFGGEASRLIDDLSRAPAAVMDKLRALRSAEN